MRNRFLGVQILLFCAVASLSTAVEDQPALQKILEGRYTEMKQAMAVRNAEAIAALLAPDFASEDADGHISTKDEMISKVTSLPTDPNKISETRVLSVQEAGETAIVKQRYQMKTTRLDAGADQPNEILLVTLSTDTWVKVNGNWLMKRTVTEKLDLSVNGVPAAHKEHRP